MYDTGANIAAITQQEFLRIKSILKDLKLCDSTIPVHQGDGSDMAGLLGTVSVSCNVYDSQDFYCKITEHTFHVYKSLNYPIIIGREFMNTAGVKKLIVTRE